MKNVVMCGKAVYGWIWAPLAAELKRRHGIKIHFICSNPKSVEYWKKQDRHGVIDTFTITDHFFFEYDNCTGSHQEIYNRARYYENKYKTFVVDFLQTDRHLGRGFSSAGVGHPKSELSNKATYIKSVNLFNKLFKFWEEYFDKTKPDLIIGAPSGNSGKICSVVARERRIPVRDLTTSRYQLYFYWTTDEYLSFPQLEINFDSIRELKDSTTGEEPFPTKRLPQADTVYKQISKIKSAWNLAAAIIEQVKKHIYRKFNKVISMGNYMLFENIKYLYRIHRDIRSMGRLKTIDIKKLSELNYIFYPLHAEPEIALGIWSPEFNEQLALIELLAKNLPAGTFLVVKEHLSAFGRRPKDFYSTLLDIPNVVMVSPHEYALDVIEKARGVAVITGTSGTESAILGIPVISFGIHNIFNFLDHVHVVESWKELRPLLSKLCGEDTEEAKKRRREDGMRYLEALKASSMELQGCDRKIKDRKPATEKELEILYTALMKSLDLSSGGLKTSEEEVTKVAGA